MESASPSSSSASAPAPTTHKLLRPENVRSLLESCNDPAEAILDLQKSKGLQDENCQVVFPLLDLLDVSREELCRTLLKQLVAKMVERVSKEPKAVLTTLLIKTLPFLTVPELEEIPRSILTAHTETPDAVLKILGSLDKTLIASLPKRTRQRMWERHRVNFEEHIAPMIESYRSDYATMSTRCEMHSVRLNIPRKRRLRQKALQELVAAVGSSVVLYQRVVDLVRSRYLETGDKALCALRADLLMSVHDAGVHEITKSDPCHQLAWYMDAYTKQLWLKLTNGPVPLKEATRGLAEILKELKKVAAAADAASRSDGSSLASLKALKKVPTVTEKRTSSFKTLMLEAIRKIKKEDKMKTFHKPVVEMWPALIHSYPQRIKHPMDLGTIQHKIQRDMYVTVEEVRKDLSLIAENAATFNGPQNEFAVAAHNIMNVKAARILDAIESKLSSAQDETAETKERRQQQAEQQRILLKQQQKKASRAAKALRDRQVQALGDATMILASGYAQNALCCSLWLALDAEVIKEEALPRDAPTAKDLIWLMYITQDCLARIDEKPTEAPQLPDELQYTIMPLLAQVQLDGIEYRTVKTGNLDELDLQPLSKRFVNECRSSDFILRAFAFFVCSRVRVRDYGAAFHYLREMKQLRDVLLGYNPFLHSLTTAFHFSSIPQKLSGLTTVTPVAGRKRPLHLMNMVNKIPHLPPSLRVEVIEWFYLPTIMGAIAKGPAALALAHAHLARFMTLESSIKIIPIADKARFCKTAFATLIATVDEEPKPIEDIRQNKELLDQLLIRYVSSEFKRAQRYYEKLFERFPNLRAQCGVPSEKELIKLYGAAMSSRTPNPTPSPSPMPSPSTDSPFPVFASSPMVTGGGEEKSTSEHTGDKAPGNGTLGTGTSLSETSAATLNPKAAAAGGSNHAESTSNSGASKETVNVRLIQFQAGNKQAEEA